MMNDEFSALPAEVSAPPQQAMIPKEFSPPAEKTEKPHQPKSAGVIHKLMMFAASSVTTLAAAGMIFSGTPKSSRWETADAAMLANANTVILSGESRGEGRIHGLNAISAEQETEIAFDYSMSGCTDDKTGIMVSILPSEETTSQEKGVDVVFCGNGQDSISLEDRNGNVLTKRLVNGQLDDNAWHHTVLTLSGQKLSVSVDGSFVLSETIPDLGAEQKLELRGTCPSMVSDLTENQTPVTLTGAYQGSGVAADLEALLRGHDRYVSMGRAPTVIFQTTEVIEQETIPEEIELTQEEPFELGELVASEDFKPVEQILPEQEQKQIRGELNQRMETMFDEGIADGTIDDSMYFCYFAKIENVVNGEVITDSSVIYLSATWSSKMIHFDRIAVSLPGGQGTMVGILYHVENLPDGSTIFTHQYFDSQAEAYIGTMEMIYIGSEIYFNGLTYYSDGWMR